MKLSYQNGELERFQLVSSNGIANFQMQYFLYKYNLLIPPVNVLQEFISMIYPFVINFPNDENQYLMELRDYLLPKLISGEIRVKEAHDKVKQVI